MRYYSLILLILFSATCIADEAVVTNSPNIKLGTLKSDEVWSGDIYLVGDVIIPEGIRLTIEAGTRLFYAEYDISKSGKDPRQTEIIVKGELQANSTEENPILVATIGDPDWKSLSSGERSVELEFKPYLIDTEPMREEFHLFKKQYLTLWSLVYAMWMLAL